MFPLLSNEPGHTGADPCTYMYMYLQVVLADIEHSESVVGAQDGAEVLPVLRAQVVCSQPQLLQVLIELHSSHCVCVCVCVCERVCVWVCVCGYMYTLSTLVFEHQSCQNTC